MRRGSIVAAVLTAAALVLVVAACGGGGSAAPKTTTTTTGTGPSGNIGPTGAGPTGSSGPGFASASNCRDFALIGAKIASAIGSTSGSGTSSAAAAKAELQAWADAAPPEIKGDFQTIATAFSNFLDQINASGYTLGSTTPPTAAQIAALTAAAKAFATPQVKQASKNIQTWVSTNCSTMHG
jgi:hypothetical protein